MVDAAHMGLSPYTEILVDCRCRVMLCFAGLFPTVLCNWAGVFGQGKGWRILPSSPKVRAGLRSGTGTGSANWTALCSWFPTWSLPAHWETSGILTHNQWAKYQLCNSLAAAAILLWVLMQELWLYRHWFKSNEFWGELSQATYLTITGVDENLCLRWTRDSNGNNIQTPLI